MIKKLNRYIPLGIILGLMVVLYFSGWWRFFSFEILQAYHKELKTFVALYPIRVSVAFILIYISFTALSVPGGIFISLIGGYLFPQPLSTLYVLFSATVGATLIFLAAKTAFGDLLKERAGPFLRKMEAGFKENAASYLLFLRFVPLFPFWAVNLAPAFFNVPLRTFVWTTLIGITPGAIIFTYAGAGLDRFFESDQPFSLGAIFSPEVKIALILLGIISLVPVILKKIRKNP